MLKPYSLEQFMKRRKELSHKSWQDYTPFEKWWDNNCGWIIGLFIVGLFASMIALPAIYWDEMDTWTIVDKDTGIRYENARYANRGETNNCNGQGWCSECEENSKPIYGYESLKKTETNQQPEGVSNPLYLKVGDQYITLKNWEKVDFKVVNQRYYCKNIGEFAEK